MMSSMPRSITTHIDSPSQLGFRLREARERAGMSQRQLSFDGCTSAYISRLEAGARVPSLQMVNELASRARRQPPVALDRRRGAVRQRTDLLEASVALRIGDVDEAEQLYRGAPAAG